jgi:hypothetical protein
MRSWGVISMQSLDERFDNIEDIIKQPDFLQNKGLGNEVGYYVFDYEPENELYIRSRVQSLINKVNNNQSNIWKNALTLNLRDLIELQEQQTIS